MQYISRGPEDKIELTLNRTPVAPEGRMSDEGWVTYRPEPRRFRPGDNALSFRALTHAQERKPA